MLYDYHFFGMHMFWWFFWIMLLFLMFGWFEPVPKKRVRRDSALDILQKRFAAGEITLDEYNERRAVLERDTPGARMEPA